MECRVWGVGKSGSVSRDTHAGHRAGGCEHVLNKIVAPDGEVEARAPAEIVGLQVGGGWRVEGLGSEVEGL